MEVKPYIPHSVRVTKRWKDASVAFGCHPVILRKAFWDLYRNMDSGASVIDDSYELWQEERGMK